MLELESIAKSYPAGFRRRHVVIADFSLLMTQGRIIGLVGPSGCGKSTLGRIILGLEQPDQGRVLFRGRDIRNMKRSSTMIFRKNVQMVPQHPEAAFNPRFSIGASLREVFRFHPICPPHQQATYLETTLRRVCVPTELLDRYPTQLSGGEIQRLAIARAILTNPSLLVLDEVTSMVDVSVQAAIIHMLRELHAEYSTTYLFITHDLALANAFCDEILFMDSCGSFPNGGVTKQCDVLHGTVVERESDQESVHPARPLDVRSTPCDRGKGKVLPRKGGVSTNSSSEAKIEAISNRSNLRLHRCWVPAIYE